MMVFFCHVHIENNLEESYIYLIHLLMVFIMQEQSKGKGTKHYFYDFKKSLNLYLSHVSCDMS